MFRGRALFLLLLITVEASGDLPTQRVENVTLNVPQTAPSAEIATYFISNAFPGVSFTNPLALATPPGETNRLFVVEQHGRIIVITNLAAPSYSVFLDLTNRVTYPGGAEESGLLGLAFHPNYADPTNGYFFIYYTAAGAGHTNCLSRFRVSADNPNVADTNSEVFLLNQFDECPNHNGAELLFDTNGYLYVSLGDEGNPNDTCNGGNSQRIDKDFFSGILRIDVDKRTNSLPPNPHASIVAPTNYAIPPDNPFIGATQFNGIAVTAAAVRTEFWAVGLRNPFRMSFDDLTHELYVGDVGQNAREEVDIIQKGGNYGWKYREGFVSNSIAGSPPPGFINYIDPILDYTHVADANGGFAVIGGRVYRGNRFPELVGKYIFGDNVIGNIWSLTNNSTNATTKTLMANAGGNSISSFGRDPRDGELLICDLLGDRILKLERVAVSTNFPQTLSQAGVFADLTTLTPFAGIVPYDLNVPFWSDNAIKRRWFSLPNTNLTVTFNRESPWGFPAGTVWIKHFDLLLTSGVPSSAKRIETRLLVKNASGSGGYGATYRWGTSTNDASLVFDTGLDEDFIINDSGTIRTQKWRYPSRVECLACHRAAAGFSLGFNTVQLNRDRDYDGTITNQIRALNAAGYFSTNVTEFHTLPALAHPTNEAYSLEYRFRSYVQANCRQCHFPGSPVPALWDARILTPMSSANIINGSLTNDMGNANNRIIVPGVLSNSMLLSRISVRGASQMPPLATSILDTQDIALVTAWISGPLTGYQSFADWQLMHFASTNAPDTGPAEDFDEDGSPNYQEWLTGSNPTNDLDSWAVGGVNFTGSAPRIVFDQIANRGFIVEGSTNLMDGASWHALDVPGNKPIISSTTQEMSVEDITNVGDTSEFYRVDVFEP